MSKKIFNVITFIIISLVVISAAYFLIQKSGKLNNLFKPQPSVNSYEECVAAGNPVMESYPPQCMSDGKVFTQEVTEEEMMEEMVYDPILTEEEARVIAEETCLDADETIAEGKFNEYTQTWWFDAELNETPEGCNPACVVDETNLTAEINWRCTGAMPGDEDSEDDKMTEEEAIESVNAEADITYLFKEKYPEYADTLYITIEQEDENHIRGGVTFVEGEAGGIFLATNINGEWEIVHEGNGQIPCDLYDYDFSEDMLFDCAE